MPIIPLGGIIAPPEEGPPDQGSTGVEEAARLLGIEKGSVKKRIQRGKLRSERDVSGTVYVYVDKSETVRDESQRWSETSRDKLLESKDETITILHDQLHEEKEARRRADTIIAQLARTTEEQARTIRELEAPSEAESSEAAETVEQEPEGAEPRSAAPVPQAGVRRPWWRRIFGEGS